jgi:hypothetical protein
LIGVVDKYTFSGRTRVPLIKKLNPIWWFGNDTEQSADEAPWYHPEWSRARRYFYWNFLRNPLQNFRCFMIGVQDRNYVVTGRYPVLTVQRDDLVSREYGFQCSVIWLLVPRPFISYSGKYVVWYVGTSADGDLRPQVQPTPFAPLTTRTGRSYCPSRRLRTMVEASASHGSVST